MVLVVVPTLARILIHRKTKFVKYQNLFGTKWIGIKRLGDRVLTAFVYRLESDMRQIIIFTLTIFSVNVYAEGLEVPYVFEADKRAVASEVNENFRVLVDGINTNQSELDSITTEVNENRVNLNTLIDQVNSSQQNVSGQSAQLTTVAQSVQNSGEMIKDINDDLSTKNLEINSNRINIDTNSTKIESNRIVISEQHTAIAQKQTRVTGACSEGSSIRVINADGSVVCEEDDVSVDSGGDITGVSVGNGLIGGGSSGDLNLVIDTNVIQSKLKNSMCATDEYISKIDGDGSATCTPLNRVKEITSTSMNVESKADGSVSINIEPASVSSAQLMTNSVDSSKLQSNAVSSSIHIADEPGITTTINDFVCQHSAFSSCEGIVLDNYAVEIARVTINAPAAGFVMLSFSGNYFIDHNAFQSETLEIEISDSDEVKVCESTFTNDPDPLPMTACNNSYREINNIIRESSERAIKGAVHSQMQISVPSEGVYTYYVYGKIYSYPIVSYSEIREHSFTAIYFPTSY